MRMRISFNRLVAVSSAVHVASDAWEQIDSTRTCKDDRCENAVRGASMASLGASVLALNRSITSQLRKSLQKMMISALSSATAHEWLLRRTQTTDEGSSRSFCEELRVARQISVVR